MKSRLSSIFSGASLALLLSAAPAPAHHSAAAYFLLDEQITVSGRVEELVFRPPHAVLRFIVTNEAGEDELWRVETLPSNMLYRRGWRFNMFEKGLEITVTGSPARDESLNAMLLDYLVTEDGRHVSAAGIEPVEE